MSAGASTAAQLLKMDDGEFNTTIQGMSVKKLLETISVLQKEMGKEQENFNSLSAELGNLKKNSGQYKSVSKDMAASQRRLTTLMDRSMKCFSQQGQQQNKESATEKNSQKSALQNRNSTGMSKSKSEVTSINPFVEVKSSNSVSNSGSTSTESVQSTRTSFAEAKNMFSGGQQNGSPVLRPKTNNPADVKRSQSMSNTDSSKRWSTDVSNGVSVDARPKSDIEGVKSSKSENTSVSNVSLKPVSSASTLTVGPLANQSNKFISRSTDNVFNKSNDEVNGKDVVRGKVPNSKPMVVMTADRQYLDLDSFTDRKNLMSELKSFNKELKPVTKNNPEQPKLVKDFGLKDVPKDNKVTAQKTSLLSDIRLGKKPSDVKDKNDGAKELRDTKQTNSVVKAPEPTLNGSEATTGLKTKQESVPVTKDKDTKTIVNGNSNKVNNKSDKGMNGVNVVINAFKEIDETDAAISEITVADQTETLPASSQSEDSESQSSELSDEEDKFVTEFTFQQKPSITHGGLNTIPEVAKSGKSLVCFFSKA